MSIRGINGEVMLKGLTEKNIITLFDTLRLRLKYFINVTYILKLSINVNIFMSVLTIHFREEGGVCENQHFFHTLLTFWPDFYYFHGDLWVSEIDIDGQPLNQIVFLYLIVRLISYLLFFGS